MLVTQATTGLATVLSTRQGIHWLWLVVPFVAQGIFTIAWELRPRRADQVLTALLHRLYHDLNPPAEAKVRITLFVANKDRTGLTQVARYRWDGKHEIGKTEVRWGVGPSGRALSERRVLLIRDVNEDNESAKGSFEKTLEHLGMSADEVHKLRLKDRRCYICVPVIEIETKSPTAVICIDSCERDGVDPRAKGLAESYAKSILFVLSEGGAHG